MPSVTHFSPPLDPHPKCLSKTHIILGEGIQHVFKCLVSWRWYAHYPTGYTSSLQSSPSVVSFIRDWKEAFISCQKLHLKPSMKLNVATWGAVMKAKGTAMFLLRSHNPFEQNPETEAMGHQHDNCCPLKVKAALFYYRIKEVGCISTNKSLKGQQFHQKFLPCSPTFSLPFPTFCQGATCYLVCLLIACHLLPFHLHQWKW